MRSEDPNLVTMLDDKQWGHLRARFDLTPREQQVAALVCQGLKTVAIAERLRVRPGTVKTHIRNVYRKVKVGNRINMLLRFMAEAGGSPASCSET